MAGRRKTTGSESKGEEILMRKFKNAKGIDSVCLREI